MKTALLLSFLMILQSMQSGAQELPSGSSSVYRQGLEASWKFRTAAEENEAWFPAEVPGCVHTDLVKNAVIHDPFAGTNEKECQWVGETNWNYRTEPFDVSAEVLNMQLVRLRFSGLDTYATVKLNGEVILHADNAHRSWEIDVKPYLKTSGNVLDIVFESPMTIGAKRLKDLPYPLPGEGIRAVSRKPQFHFGWDWAPKLLTCGISKPVEIIAYNQARFDDIYIQQENVTAEKAEVRTLFYVHSLVEVGARVVFEMSKTGEYWTSDVDLKSGMNLVELPFTIDRPDLWWCNDLGKQNLYEFNAWLLINNQVVDMKKTHTGLRTVELIQEKDSIGESFLFRLNGKDVFIKGANYIPITYFPAQAGEAEYRRLLESCRDSHFNMLRVWGGGVYEDENFYRLCDEMGIMVWQDFMFACSMYPADSLFVASVIAEAEEQTIRLRNHPCMALWCGNNENAEGWERWGWQIGLSEKNKNQLWRAYKDVFDLTLSGIVKKNTNLDYWESSPRYGRGDSRSLTEGDSHYWGVWHDEEPFEVMLQKVPRFMSEFGMQSFPSDDVLREMMTGATGSYKDPGMEQHQKHGRGFKLMDKYMERWYPFVPHDSLYEYSYMTQVVQAEGIGLGIEAQRRSMPRCMGTMYWQLNDVWPAFSWAGIDYKGNHKVLHDYLQILYAPQLISTVIENDELRIYWISDNYVREETGILSWRILDADGKVVSTSPGQSVQLTQGSHILLSKKVSELFPAMDLKDKVIEVNITGSRDWKRIQKLSYQSSVLLVPAFNTRYSEDPLTGKKVGRTEVGYEKRKKESP